MKKTIAYPLQLLGCLLVVFSMSNCASGPGVSPVVVSAAKQRLKSELGTEPRQGTLVVVDYSKPSYQNRMSVVDLQTGRSRMNCRVAHGVNSGNVYATRFSNTPGSRKSSLGLFRVAEQFNGKHGPSFRLDGLDPSLNSRARARGIIVHSAEYATFTAMMKNSSESYRLGRSAGCLSIAPADLNRLKSTLRRPAYVYAYGSGIPAPTMLVKAPAPATSSPPASSKTRLATKLAAKPAPEPEKEPQPKAGAAAPHVAMQGSSVAPLAFR